jgi:hypothetical protein
MAQNDRIVSSAAYLKVLGSSGMATFQLEWRHPLVVFAIGWCPHEPALKMPCEVVSLLGGDLVGPRFQAARL